LPRCKKPENGVKPTRPKPLKQPLLLAALRRDSLALMCRKLTPLEQREVLLLVGLEDLSYADVALALGVPPGTVMSRLSRARGRLRAVLAGELTPPLRVVNP
jgi:DNA-directed RNA polymerase specialized sigma24 family protein